MLGHLFGLHSCCLLSAEPQLCDSNIAQGKDEPLDQLPGDQQRYLVVLGEEL